MSFGRQIDLEIDNITLLATGVDNRDPSLSSFTKERIRLPMNLKGLGIRDLATRGASEYIRTKSITINHDQSRARQNVMIRVSLVTYGVNSY